jgi:hypothetical protein
MGDGWASTSGVAALDAEQRALVGAYWWRRAQGELRSWVGFQHVLADLRMAGSPAAVIALAERAVEDEYRHSVWCAEWAERFGHPGGELRPATRPVTFDGASDDENRLLRIALCCLTESAGCFILRRARQAVTDPDLRRLNRRHLADELSHSRVGWAHLSTLDARGRDVVRTRLPELLTALSQACSHEAGLDREDLVPWGYFTPRLLRAAHDEALSEVIWPGLEHVGIGAAS